MASRPWMKFYPTDWRADPKLRSCSLSARGLWMEMLCLMHEADPRGSLLINGQAVSDQQVANLSGVSLKQATACVAELEAAGVFSRDENGTVYSRRIRRDDEKAERDKANGKGGGNPKLNGGVNPDDNGGVKAQKLEARSQKPEKKDSEANASADLSIPDFLQVDVRADLFGRGLETLARITGKTPDSCRSLVGKWLKSVNDEAIHVLGALDDAARNRVADPVAWITASLSPHRGDKNGKRTVHDAAADLHERVRALNEPAPTGIRDGTGEGSIRLLPPR